MKTKWEVRFFFEKNLRKQFNRALDSESNGGIFDSLARVMSYGDLKNEICAALTAYAKFFFMNYNISGFLALNWKYLKLDYFERP